MHFGLEDIRLALAKAEEAAVPMPTLEVVRDRLIAGVEHGYVAAEVAGPSTQCIDATR
jgi:hypothetical protein